MEFLTVCVYIFSYRFKILTDIMINHDNNNFHIKLMAKLMVIVLMAFNNTIECLYKFGLKIHF